MFSLTNRDMILDYLAEFMQTRDSNAILTSPFGLKLPNCILYELRGKNTAFFKSTGLYKKQRFKKLQIFKKHIWDGMFKLIFS